MMGFHYLENFDYPTYQNRSPSFGEDGTYRSPRFSEVTGSHPARRQLSFKTAMDAQYVCCVVVHGALARREHKLRYMGDLLLRGYSCLKDRFGGKYIARIPAIGAHLHHGLRYFRLGGLESRKPGDDSRDNWC